jgi:hypothetical protein
LATHVDVLSEVIDDGFAVTAIPVIVTGVTGAETAVVFMDAVPNFVPSCVDVAVQEPAPGPEGLKTPLCVIVPPAAVHVTTLL